MTDLVRVLEEFSKDSGLEFRYGSRAHLNLLEADLDDEVVYLLLFPLLRTFVFNKNKTRIAGTRYSGKIMLLKGSDYSENYFNENDSDSLESKYTNNIEPLLESCMLIAQELSCKGLDFEVWKAQDAVNVLDANKDGVWITFTIYQGR